ncbi:MAG TPA: protein phosphatase 2C domain-containing protein [Bryobacteraceae bacterium]|nr:protein phosphatase 2C domain-containing protein [Bryobacteraceae bacterium]
MPTNSKLRLAGASDPGRVRNNNEDALYVDAERGIFLVVDGIGGQAAGEKAAEIAVGRVRARLERQTGTAEQRVREAIAMANNEILRAARDNPEWHGMACVLTVAVLDNGSAVVGHVGDSRLYQIRGGEIRKITHDHSPVGEREDNHEISEEEAMRHPRRNEVFRDVGSEEHAPDDADFIEVQRVLFQPDSALLLCSDGLSDQVDSHAIQQMVESNAGNPEEAVRRLVGAANAAGGKDNVTVVLVEGESFTAPPAGTVLPGRREKPEEESLMARILWFAGGLAVAAAAAWFTRTMWVPPAVVEKPRVLLVGTGTSYPSIAAAMSAARAGDTVEVPGGEYNEQVHLAAGVTLRSRVPREAVLRAAPLNTGPAVIGENISGARFTGFRILVAKDLPISTGILLDNAGVEVDDVEVDGAGIGIEVRGTASPVLRADSIHDCITDGVLILGGSQAWISHNDIRRNKGAGLAARDGAHPALLDNVFEKNVVEVPDEMKTAVKERNLLLDLPVTPRRTAPPAKKLP